LRRTNPDCSPALAARRSERAPAQGAPGAGRPGSGDGKAIATPRIWGSWVWLCLATCLLIAGCATQTPSATQPAPAGADGAPAGNIDFASIPDAVPRPEPLSRYGNPPFYEAEGQRYETLPSSQGYVERGIASWYGTKFHGRLTSSREPYDLYAMTAAHRTLPLPCYVRVTNLQNGRSVVVRVNDRGPFRANRIIDLSYVAAGKLGILPEGTGLVEVRAVDPRGPEPEPVPVPVHLAAAHNPLLFVQVGAFSSRQNAERLQARLQSSLERAVRIQQTPQQPGRRLYRVQVGPLDGVDTADQVAAQLAGLGLAETQVVVE